MTPSPPDLAHLDAATRPALAAFDADGTLWRGDVSEDFTRWMIDAGHFDGSPWDNYAAINSVDPGQGCLAILEFYRGHALERIRELVRQFWSQEPERDWIREVVAALKWLRTREFRILIVSGTPGVVLEPLVELLPIEPEDILGLELQLDADGNATGKPTGIETHGAGKAERIRAHTRAPVCFAAGNSSLDIDMMRLATLFRWAVHPDHDLRNIARDENWWITDESRS